MTPRQKRIQHLTRVNRRQVSEPMAALALAEVLQLGTCIAELECLETTDRQWEGYQRGYAECVARDPLRISRRFFSAAGEPAALQLAKCMAEQLRTEDAYLLLHFANDFFSIGIDAGNALALFREILMLDRDTFSLVSVDISQGVSIDYNPDDQLEVYEIAVWGDRWKPMTQFC